MARVSDRVRRRLLGHRVTPLALLGALLLADAGVLLYMQRDMTFLVDEWLLLVERRGWDVDTFLLPFYEHLFLVPIAVFKVLMSAIGIGPHWVYAVPLIALHLTCVVLVYLLARPRVGAWLALAPATLILFLGSSYDNMLLPIQVSFLGSMAAGLSMLLVLDLLSSLRRDAIAALLLVVSLASSSVGLVFAIAGLIEIASKPDWRRRLWVVLVPAMLYGLWFLAYGPRGLEQGSSLSVNLPYVPGHAADAAAAVFGAISGLGFEWGRILAVVAFVLVIRALLDPSALSPRFAGLLVAVVCFWVLGGLARGHQGNPEASRYLYPGAVFMVLLAVESLRSVRPKSRWAALLAAGVALAALGNANTLRGARDTHQAFSKEVSAQFAALEVLGREGVDPDFVAAVYLAPLVTAEEYFDMVDALGSPVDLTGDVLMRSERERSDADAVLAAALPGIAQHGATLDPAAPPPVVEEVRFGLVARSGPCIRFKPPDGGDGTLVVRARHGGALVRVSPRSPVTLAVRRFSRSFHTMRRLAPSASFAFQLPNGGSTLPWRLRARTRDTVEICTTRPARPS